MKQAVVLLIVCLCIISCAASNTVQVRDADIVKTTDTPELTIFLLERDIPQTIKRLGTVSISIKVTTFNVNQIDGTVKAKLRDLCKEASANGAYRLNDGTYSPYVVSYLIFHCDK